MKTTRLLSASGAAIFSVAALLALAPAAHATTFPNLVYDLTINTSSLVANPNGTFSLDFQLATGSGNVPNTVTLSNFQFIGGAPTGTDTFTSGNETGSLASTVVLTNGAADSDNEFAESFTSGTTQISFQVNETPNSEVVGSGTPTPDQLNIAILDSTISNIPTTDPSTNNELVSSVLGSTSNRSTVETFSSLSPDGGVTVVVSAPEPSSTALFLLGFGGLVGLLGLRRNRA